MQNTKVEDDKKKKRRLLLLLLLFITAGLFWFFMTYDYLGNISVTAKLETINISTFDKEETRVEALLNNIIVVIDENAVTIDPINGAINGTQLQYIDGKLSINMTDISKDGEVIVTVDYLDMVATTTFKIVYVGPRRVASTESSNSDNSDEPETPEPNDPGIGNVIDAPAEISPIRDINSEVAETPEDKNSNEEVSDESAVVDPVDVATPVNNPETNQEPAPEVAYVSYNKVSIIFDSGESLSLFSNLGGGKLVIMYKDGNYINASSGNRIDFSVGGDDVISFSMTEYNASGTAIATSNGSYSK